jgi:GH24 family phage-related lysozyme (muramidase)
LFKKPSIITDEFLKDYCGNSHSPYYDDFCISSGRGAAWNIKLGIQNGTSKYKNNGKEAVFQDLIRYAIEDKWKSVNNFTHAMDYLKAAYSSAFNQGDPYQGTLGLYSKLYYMKDAT